MSITPAMLVYLSNADNVKAAPNENFARELLELFTLGVNQYTQADVEAAARAWTGHNYDYDGEQYIFRATKHDTLDKTFFGVTKNWDGPQIIDEILVNNPAKQLIAAKFIAKKLWEFLAYVGPSATIVDALAATFVAGGMEIKPLVQAILNHDEFYSVTARQGLVRTPIEFIVALCYHTGLRPDDFGVAWRAEQTGQQLYQPPNVSGWRPNAYWLNTSALSGRASFAESASYHLRQNSGFNNLYTLSAAAGVDYVANLFGFTGTQALSATTRTMLIDAHGKALAINRWWAATDLIVMMLLTPEFHMA
jgi:uncharacterized protein (DUF1800 family)